MQLSRRQRFYDWARYPQLESVRARWPAIRDEAIRTTDTLEHHLLPQMGPSYVLPLVPEPEDRNVIADELYAQARGLAPLTTELVSSIPFVVAFAFSKLVPGKHIAPHEHWNPYLVAILCLQHGGGSHIIVGAERRDFADGEIILFDYTQTHEARNEGTEPRYVLLMVIDPRRQ